MTQTHRYQTIVLAALLVVTLIGSTAAPAGAAHENDDVNTGLGDALSPDDDSRTAALLGAVSGGVDRTLHEASSLVGDSPSANDSATGAVSAFNDHSETFVEYANARNISEGEVLAIEFQQDGTSETVYIVANYSDGDYQSAEAVHETDREVNHKVALQDIAAVNADEEIDRFYDEFAAPGKDPTQRYTSEMTAKYAGTVDEPFTGE